MRIGRVATAAAAAVVVVVVVRVWCWWQCLSKCRIALLHNPLLYAISRGKVCACALGLWMLWVKEGVRVWS